MLIANYIPFSAPEGAPNFNSFSPNVLYEINIDTVGDGLAHVKYQFQFETTRSSTPTFLYNTGPVTTLADPDLHVRQTYSVTEIVTYGTNVTTTTLASDLPVPPPHIGSKSTPNYAALVNEALSAGQISNGGDDIKVFAGPRDDPFWVDLGSIFDLLSLRGQASPIGYPGGPTVGVDNLTGFNVYSLAIEVPAARLLDGAPEGETVIGGWTSASRRSTRVLANITDVLAGDAASQDEASGPYVQVSRLGMPLVNEAVIPAQLKDAFNNLAPSLDAVIYTADTAPLAGVGDLLQTSVEDPELGRLLCALYSVPLPRDTDANCSTEVDLNTPGSGRIDIFKIFLTGMTLTDQFTINTATGPVTLAAGTVVNQPTKGSDGNGAGIVPAEMLRLNTALKGDLCAPMPSRLGVLGGDACGFPNGRRLADDVVEIELLAVAGAAFNVLAPAAENFAFNADLIGVLSDSVDRNDRPFSSTFPYLAMPHQGQEHVHTNLNRLNLMMVAQ
ncbi:MAG: DUF4331 domain-containing protein [Oscillochloris sp.]|nr:DUF4331 domain-containing protein [Oscillochloris sp.]